MWGGPEPLDHIPEGIAKPLWEVSKKLGMPPVLGESAYRVCIYEFNYGVDGV